MSVDKPDNMITVAIVDDKPLNINTLKDKLSFASNVKILFTAINGEDFLEKIKNCTQLPDIVIMDIEMPVMNGIEAVNIATELYPSTKFLMLTVFDDEEKIFEAIKAGAIGYLLKDESSDKIIQALYEIIEYGGAPMSPSIARKSIKMLSKSKSDGLFSVITEKSNLSDREMEILKGLVDGKDYKKIAEHLFLSPNTVRTHITNIYRKLKVNSKLQAVNLAKKKNWFGIL